MTLTRWARNRLWVERHDFEKITFFFFFLNFTFFDALMHKMRAEERDYLLSGSGLKGRKQRENENRRGSAAAEGRPLEVEIRRTECRAVVVVTWLLSRAKVGGWMDLVGHEG